MTKEPDPTPLVAWHAMRVVARRTAQAHRHEASTDIPPDWPINLPGARQRRHDYWLAVGTRLAVLECTHAALALDVGHQRDATVLADELEAGAALPGPLQDAMAELAIAVRRFANTAPAAP